MPRVISFVVLLAIVLLIGMKFFEVMVLFVVPLFLAAVLVVVFKPVHLWIFDKVGRRRRLAAALTTFSIILIVLLPTLTLATRAVFEGMDLYSQYASSAVEGGEAIIADQSEQGAVQGEVVGEKEPNALDGLIAQIVDKVNELLARFNLPEQDAEEWTATVEGNLVTTVTPIAVGGVRIFVSTVVGLAIMVIATYYFFADGPYMLIALMRMSPLDDAYERELLEKFSDISRSVVMATILSAVAQGILAGIGYYFVGIERLFFFVGATIFFAMIPFVGSAFVWGLVCLWLYFVEDRGTAALVLAAYGTGVISMVDNIIKPYILHGQANLHPLLALLSVIGGVQVLGPIGILVGPMLVAFLQALINMLNKEIAQMGTEIPAAIQPVIDAVQPTPDDDVSVIATPTRQP